jgi:sulfur carrier protein
MMRLRLNGKEREVGEVVTVEELIAALGIHRKIVVEHNGVILAQEQYPATRLTDGDALEIAHFVGGG